MHQKNKDILLPLSLFFLTIITRVPFASKLLYHWDSVQFALALEKYDITVHQPHPPGYFLYVMLGRFLNFFIKDANSTFVFISIIFSGLTVVAVYYLGKELYDGKIGLLAAAIALTSPNLWFHGEVALTYIVEAFFSTAVAVLCWKIYKGEHKYIYLSVVTLGIAGGIRQSTIVFLLPLWLFSIRGVPLRKIITSLGLIGIICLLWFVPMVWMTGGWNAYSEAFKEYRMFVIGHSSVFEKGWTTFKIFSTSLFDHLIYGVGTGIFILGLATYSLIRYSRLKSLERTKVLFLSLWMLPSVFFYLMIWTHPACYGYVLILLPTLFILVAASIKHISAEFKQVTGKDISTFIALAIILINACIFFFSKYPISYREIRNHDRGLSIVLDSIKTFNPLNTAVFVGPYLYYGFRHIMYYLPEYIVYQVEVKVAPTGEMRKTFWGVNKETFLTDEIVLPKNVNNFTSILILDDKDKVPEIKGVSIKQLLNANVYIASGPLVLVNKIYPELKIRLQDNSKDNKYEQ
jgi:hypothetical protein